MISMITISVTLISSTLLFYFFMFQSDRKRAMQNRINEFIPVFVSEKQVDLKSEKSSNWVITSLTRVFANFQFSEKNKLKLEKGGSSLKVEEFVLLRVFSGIGLALLFYLFRFPLLVILLTVPIGCFLPDVYMNRKYKKRLHLLSFQLVEALGTMSNSLRAGFSFTQTMQLIGKEMPDPIGPEFERVVRELSLGIPMEKVCQGMLIRLPNKELEVVFQAILTQRQTGGNLAELLETMEETIRGRIRILEELKTLTAQGKLSSWIITLLPVIMGLYLYFASPDYFRPMLEYPLGWLMLAGGIVSLGIGWIMVQKIIKIEV